MCKELVSIKKLIEQIECLTLQKEYRSDMSIDGRSLFVTCFCKNWMLSLVGVFNSAKDCSLYIQSNTHFEILYHGHTD